MGTSFGLVSVHGCHVYHQGSNWGPNINKNRNINENATDQTKQLIRVNCVYVCIIHLSTILYHLLEL